MSKRKSQTAVADYIAPGVHPRGARQLPRAPRLVAGDRGGGVLAGRARRALRPGHGPEGRGRVRPRAARVAQRPVDPPPVRRRPGRARCCRSSRPIGIAGRTIDRDAHATTSCARCCRWCSERLPTLAAIGDLVGLPVRGRAATWIPALLVPKRWDVADDARRPGGGPGRASPAHGAVAWEADELEPPLRALVEARGWKAGDLFMAIRVAVTGRTATPPLFDTLVALGRERTLARLDAARGVLAGCDRGVTRRSCLVAGVVGGQDGARVGRWRDDGRRGGRARCRVGRVGHGHRAIGPQVDGHGDRVGAAEAEGRSCVRRGEVRG